MFVCTYVRIYTYTQTQFHTSSTPTDDDGADGEDEMPSRDWLHSDGGLPMMKRVLVGLYKQRTLHTLAEKVCCVCMYVYIHTYIHTYAYVPNEPL